MKHPGIHKDPQKQKVWAKRSWDERIAQHFKAHELPNVAKETLLGHEVYIGVNDEKMFDELKAYPAGYFKTAFAVGKGKEFFVQILEFEGNHDENMTDEARLKARVQKTIVEASNFIHTGKTAGLYEN